MQFLALEVLRNTPAVTTLSCLFFYVFLVMCACCSWRTGLAAKASGERSEFPPAFDVVHLLRSSKLFKVNGNLTMITTCKLL